MTNLSRNLFTNAPVEFSIPRNAKIVFVSDFFAQEINGGAELTTEAVIEHSQVPIFKLHSSSLTEDIVRVNKNKYWIITNFANADTDGLQALIDHARYSVIEYDFKYCKFRSSYRHFLESGKPCDCAASDHGKLVEKLFNNADNLFWMSEKQKIEYYKQLPGLKDHKSNIVVSSVFSTKTLDTIKQFKMINKTKDNLWGFLGGGSWIKGCVETEAWLKLHRKKSIKIAVSGYDNFMFELSKHKGFAFKPVGLDTAPRVVMEAKLLGCELSLNNNVLHKDESWFTGSTEETEEYLRSNVKSIWNKIEI